jgi:hypothetical protein
MLRSIIVLTLLMFLLFAGVTSAQQALEWMRMLENPEYPSEKLKPENVDTKYLKYDFSTLFVPRNPFLGYISGNYRRLNIYFTSVSKSPKDEGLYLITGISLVGNNKSEFQGSIKIQQIREFANLHFGIDDTYKDAGIKAQGALIGQYKFEENRGQAHSGTFAGIMTLYWVVDRNGILQYDNIQWYSDRYNNNQYVGTWTEYGKNKGIVANWGEHRIPFSADLDNGAAEFSPTSKYQDKGWRERNLP